MEREDKIVRLREVGSTNDVVFDLSKDLGVPLFVRADVQRGGRGRFGRRWISPEGGLWMSGIFLKRHPKDNYKFMLGSTVVVEGVLSRLLEGTPHVPRIIFPNDIFVNSKKICGVLVEEREGRIIVGIGLNVNQDIPPLSTATTLRTLTGRVYDLDVLAREIADGLLKLDSMAFRDVFGMWKGRLSTLGKVVSIHLADGREVRGRLTDVREDMVLELDGRIPIQAEHILRVREI